jgi:arylformamidase
MQIFDISQTLREGIPVWPGDRPFRVRWSMQIGKGRSCNVCEISMSTHTGTHLDAPYHFDESGLDMAAVPLQNYLGPARVVSLPDTRRIGAADLKLMEWEGLERILFKTSSGCRGKERFERNFVYLSEDGAEFIGRRGLRLVGTDSPSIDAFSSKSLSSHKILSSYGVAILEGIRLDHVPDGDYELICLPLKLAGLDGSPVRAVLRK